MHTSYECDFEVEHNCNRPQDGSQPITESPTTLEDRDNHVFYNIGLAPIATPPATLDDRDKQIFRNSRHKGLCKQIKGHVIQCAACDTTVPTADIINFVLGSWRELAIKNDSNIDVTFEDIQHSHWNVKKSYPVTVHPLQPVNQDKNIFDNNINVHICPKKKVELNLLLVY